MTADTQSAMEAMSDFEHRGDEAVSAGCPDQALALYGQAERCYNDVIDWEKPVLDQVDDVTFGLVLDSLRRIRTKMSTVVEQLESSTDSPADPVAELRAEADAAMEEGDLAHASHMSFRLGEELAESGDRGRAESAFRQAVALARQVDAADPELMLAAFSSLIDFLAPSEESIALASELANHLLNRDEMYHPMRAAEAVSVWAHAELEYAEVVPERLNHVIDGIVRQALDMLDDICFHEDAQQLRYEVARVLCTNGRQTEADEWCAEADKFAAWERFPDQQIPGHVHLWDIRGSS